MGLRIQNNMAAMNAHRQLSRADEFMTKSLERLSSGYRINKAADDAAGLAISEGFRADIASFKVASRNTTEANAMLQVAEGGMEQIGNMLTRLKELATQAASSNVGTTERTKLNAEGNALISEIDRIANGTKYGSTSLLDGTFGASKTAGTYGPSAAGLGAYGALTHVYCATGTGQTAGIFSSNFITSLGNTIAYSGTWSFTAASGGVLKLSNGAITEQITVASWTIATGNQTLSFANLGITITTMSNTADSDFTTAWGANTAITLKETGLSALNVTGAASATYTFSSTGTQIGLGNGTITQQVTGLTIGASNSVNFSALNVTVTLGAKYTAIDLEAASFTVTSSGSGGNTFQIGSKNDVNNQVALSIAGVATDDLNAGLVTGQLLYQTNAQSMLTTIDSAISALTSGRGTIGASMNRLSYAAANLASTVENVQAAESAIRDVDMAAEMTTFTKNQILMQASISMLAQANQSPQLMLSLFGGR